MRQGRHGRLSSPTTWIAAAVAACVTGVVVLSTAPAEAKATTVPVQLTLSGVASSDNPTGGAVVGVHPGDSVVVKSSLLPTAGAPAGLGDALSGLLGGATGFQVRIDSGNLPGVTYPVVLGDGNCGSKTKLTLPSLAKGKYSFKYTAYRFTLLGALLGCQTAKITPTQDQLGKLTADNIKVSDNAVYSGAIVVATDPPKGQIGIQLPSQSISVKAGPISTHVNVGGATVTVPNPLPSITSKLGGVVKSIVNGAGGGTKSTSKASSKPSSNVKYTPPALTVPQKVMPHAVNVGGAGGSKVSTGFTAPQGGSNGGPLVAPAVTSTAANPGASSAASTAPTKPAGKAVDLADRSQLGGQQLPALLAIAAILALSLVTAAYARMVLLRRKPTA